MRLRYAQLFVLLAHRLLGPWLKGKQHNELHTNKQTEVLADLLQSIGNK